MLWYVLSRSQEWIASLWLEQSCGLQPLPNKGCLGAVEGSLWFQFSSNTSNKLAFLSTWPMSNSAHQDKENLLSIIKYLLGLRYIPAAKIFTNGSVTYRTFHKKKQLELVSNVRAYIVIFSAIFGQKFYTFYLISVLKYFVATYNM